MGRSWVMGCCRFPATTGAHRWLRKDAHALTRENGPAVTPPGRRFRPPCLGDCFASNRAAQDRPADVRTPARRGASIRRW